MAHAKLIFSLILAGLVALFLSQNSEAIEARFRLWSLAMSRALMIFFVFAFGILSGWLRPVIWLSANRQQTQGVRAAPAWRLIVFFTVAQTLRSFARLRQKLLK